MPEVTIQLYIFIFLHQTTTIKRLCSCSHRCISLYSYIKPQHDRLTCGIDEVVYLYIPTSNHNTIFDLEYSNLLYIFIFLHQTTTVMSLVSREFGCISLYSYIKPQLLVPRCCQVWVVYLYIPTSNHNSYRLRR